MQRATRDLIILPPRPLPPHLLSNFSSTFPNTSSVTGPLPAHWLPPLRSACRLVSSTDRHAIAVLCIIFHIDRCWKHSLWNVAGGTEKASPLSSSLCSAGAAARRRLRPLSSKPASEPGPAYGLTTSWYATFITHATAAVAARGVGRGPWRSQNGVPSSRLRAPSTNTGNPASSQLTP